MSDKGFEVCSEFDVTGEGWKCAVACAEIGSERSGDAFE
jgi:hypothetical protein